MHAALPSGNFWWSKSPSKMPRTVADWIEGHGGLGFWQNPDRRLSHGSASFRLHLVSASIIRSGQ